MLILLIKYVLFTKTPLLNFDVKKNLITLNGGPILFFEA